MYIDVDCSDVTYDSKPSPSVLKAVNETLQKIGDKNITENYLVEDENRPVDSTFSPSPNASMANSLLSSMDPNRASEHEMKEAFCRDVDSFSWDLALPERENEQGVMDWILDHLLEIALGIVGFFILIKIYLTWKERRQIRRNGDMQHGTIAFSNIENNIDQHPNQETSLPYPVKPNQESQNPTTDPPTYSTSYENPSAPTEQMPYHPYPYSQEQKNLPYPVNPPDSRPSFQN